MAFQNHLESRNATTRPTPAPGAARPAHGTGAAVALRLPPIDQAAIPSYRFAQRAPRIVLGGLFALALTAVIASFMVEMDATVVAGGSIEPTAVWPVRPLESGVIIEILARTGETVARGAPVARLDRFDSEAQTRALSFQLRERGAELERAERVLPLTLDEQRHRITMLEAGVSRAEWMLRDRLVQVSLLPNVDSVLAAHVPGTHMQIDMAMSDVRAAKADLQAGQSALARTRADSLDLVRRRLELDRMASDVARLRQHAQRLTIIAPSDGVVLTDQLERRMGAFVQAGELVLEIANLRGWHAVLLVSERDVHDVFPGQATSIEIPAIKALDGRPLHGRVSSVAPQPVAAATGLPDAMVAGAGYRVTIALDTTQIALIGTDALRRGYAVRGRVVTRSGKIAALVAARLRDRFNQHRY